MACADERREPIGYVWDNGTDRVFKPKLDLHRQDVAFHCQLNFRLIQAGFVIRHPWRSFQRTEPDVAGRDDTDL
jgi:hypothetical protein